MFRHVVVLLGASLPSAQLASSAALDGQPLEEVVVTATFREQPLIQTPASVTVLDAATLQQAGQQHVQDVLGLVPNLNWAGGTSRPRYFQIRGIGEREQYEGAPNPSVGLLIDDIDFSGIGMAATLFDVQQIEVLRGPQGTRYGANALAGLINVRTQSPSSRFQAGAQGSVASFNTRSLGGYVSTPVEALDSSMRLSVQQYRSDGFMDNAYLNRHDTNGRDELGARFKWQWRIDDAATLEATVLHANLDNGYDAWAIDNSRTSLADEPGKDSQRATGAALKLVRDFDDVTLTATGSTLDSQSLNSFDADWGNSQSWSPYTYAYFMRSDRDRRNQSLEVRLASREATMDHLGWLAGVYALRTREAGRDDLWGQYADPGDPVYADRDALTSAYRANNVAVFGQLEGQWAPRWRWTAGLRGEQRTATYRDHNEVSLSDNDLHARDRMLGGQVSLQRELDDSAHAYVTLSRGYKAGGFNLGSSIEAAQRYFAPETLWSSEVGYKAIVNSRLQMDADVFYQWRRDLQMRTGVQADPNNPGTYVFLTTNAARGYNTGVEASLRYLLATQWEVGGTLGLLRTRVSGARDANGVVAAEREQAHAPEYTASAFVTWRNSKGWMARLDVQAKDNFYFDVPTDHNQQSHAYTLTNLKAGYEAARWSMQAWVNNAFNEDYAIRGFYFSNDPPNWEQKLYIQKGDPRVVGVTTSLKF